MGNGGEIGEGGRTIWIFIREEDEDLLSISVRNPYDSGVWKKPSCFTGLLMLATLHLQVQRGYEGIKKKKVSIWWDSVCTQQIDPWASEHGRERSGEQDNSSWKQTLGTVSLIDQLFIIGLQNWESLKTVQQSRNERLEGNEWGGGQGHKAYRTHRNKKCFREIRGLKAVTARSDRNLLSRRPDRWKDLMSAGTGGHRGDPAQKARKTKNRRIETFYRDVDLMTEKKLRMGTVALNTFCLEIEVI